MTYKNNVFYVLRTHQGWLIGEALFLSARRRFQSLILLFERQVFLGITQGGAGPINRPQKHTYNPTIRPSPTKPRAGFDMGAHFAVIGQSAFIGPNGTKRRILEGCSKELEGSQGSCSSPTPLTPCTAAVASPPCHAVIRILRSIIAGREGRESNCRSKGARLSGIAGKRTRTRLRYRTRPSQHRMHRMHRPHWPTADALGL